MIGSPGDAAGNVVVGPGAVGGRGHGARHVGAVAVEVVGIVVVVHYGHDHAGAVSNPPRRVDADIVAEGAVVSVLPHPPKTSAAVASVAVGIPTLITR